MAVQSDTSRIQYAGNNSTSTSYAVPFVFQENSHLKAIARTAAGVETVVTLTNHTGAGDVNGGTVRTAVAVPATSTLTIYREVPITQTTSYAEGGDFPAASHERALDKLTQIAQQTQRQVGSTLRFSEANQLAPINPPVSATPHVLTTVNGGAPTWETVPSVSTALNIPSLTDTSTVNPSDELIVQQSGLPRRATAQELFNQQAIWNTVVPTLTDAGNVNGSDEFIVHQGGVAKRATANEVAKGVNAIHGSVNIKDFGAVGDGVADDTTAMQAALAAGGKIIFPKGTYKINIPTLAGFAVPQGTVICGDGSSVTELQMTSTQTGFVNLFDVSAGRCSIQDLKISWSTPAGSSGAIAFLFGAGGDILLRGLHVNMDVEEVGGARNAANQLFSVTGNASRVCIESCFFEYFAFGILKTNAATSSNDDWLIYGNTFENFFNPALTFNTPSGDWDNVRVVGNTLKNSLGHTAGQFEHMGGLAGGNGSGRFVFANNHFIGTGRGLNFEEGSEEVVISGNTFALTDTAIKILDNNVGGTARMPKRFVVSGNTITKTGASVEAQTDVGVEIIFGGPTGPSLTDAVITNNVITGYDRGISAAENAHTCVVQGNIIKACATGMRLVESNGEISGNTFLDCTVGINSVTDSGMVGRNTFHATPTPLQDSVGAGLGCEGMSIILDGHSVADGSNQDIVLCPQGARLAARAAYHVWSKTANSYRIGAYDLTYDGSTLTTVGGGAVVSAGSGTFGTPSFVITGGNLCLRISNSSGSAQPTNVKVSFDGPYFV